MSQRDATHREAIVSLVDGNDGQQVITDRIQYFAHITIVSGYFVAGRDGLGTFESEATTFTRPAVVRTRNNFLACVAAFLKINCPDQIEIQHVRRKFLGLRFPDFGHSVAQPLLQLALLGAGLHLKIYFGSKSKHRQTLKYVVGQLGRQAQREALICGRYIEQANDAPLRIAPSGSLAVAHAKFLQINGQLTLQEIERVSAVYH